MKKEFYLISLCLAVGIFLNDLAVKNIFAAPPGALKITEQKEKLKDALESLRYVSEGKGPALYVFGFSYCPYCQKLYNYTRNKDLGVELRHMFLNVGEQAANEMAVLVHSQDIKDFHAFMNQEKTAPSYLNNSQAKKDFYNTMDIMRDSVMPVLKKNGYDKKGLPGPSFIWEEKGVFYLETGFSEEGFDLIVESVTNPSPARLPDKKPALAAKPVLEKKPAPDPGRSPLPAFWPPRVGKEYPDMELIDQTGKPVRISDFRGKVILMEYVGMNCPGCQALSGAQKYGPYGRVVPQAGVQSIEKLCPIYGFGVQLTDEQMVFIQVLLYDMNAAHAPTREDVRKWAAHFHLKRDKDQIVLGGKEELISPASWNLIPGFQLIDKGFIVRSDSTGHSPRHDLYNHLLPMIKDLIRE